MRKKKQTPIFRRCPPANFFVQTTVKPRVLPPVRFDSRQAEMASMDHATASTSPETGWFAMKPSAPADTRMEIHVA
jgi:hypothetical protein